MAARYLDIGEELTHSYVELVEERAARQSKLSSVYGFDCQCRRCTRRGAAAVAIESLYTDTAAAAEGALLTVLEACALSGSYECLLPSRRETPATHARVEIDTDSAGSARQEGVTVVAFIIISVLLL